ncbi:MAG: hypothetical protein ACLUGJ_07770 [Blautia wexlerae]
MQKEIKALILAETSGSRGRNPGNFLSDFWRLSHKIWNPSRESTDLANVRTEYGEMMADINLFLAKIPKRLREQLKLKQKIDDWQSAETITIAGISIL